LNTELQLTPEQKDKVDAIYAEARPKFMQLRELPESDRSKARERITSEIRARVGDVLTAEQKPKYAAMVAETSSRTSTRGRIYVMDADGKPKALNVRLGISDGSSTELLVFPNSPQAADLQEGAKVITGILGGAGSGSGGSPKPATAGPRMLF
jgi:HlyD family secretion protein